MELDLNEFGKRYVTYTTYLFNGILVLGAVFIVISFFAAGETVGEIFLAVQIFSGIVFWLLPIAIVLAIIKRTRKVGGAMLYTVGVVQLAYWWITALLLLQDKGGTWWAIVGIVSSFVTAGYGIFAVTVLNAIIHGSLTGVLMFIGIPMLCRLVMNLGKGLMQIHPEQVKKKIEEFEEKQQAELDELDENLFRLETKRLEQESEIEELDEVLKEFDEIEAQRELSWESENIDDDDWDDEDYEDEQDELSDEEREIEIARLQAEIEQNKAKLREAQENQARVQGEFFELLNELAGDKDAAKEILEEMYQEAELDPGSKEYYSQQAHILWKQDKRERALLFFNKALPENRDDVYSGDDAITLMNRGNLNLELGNEVEGVSDLETAAKINPSLPILPIWEMSSTVREVMLKAFLKQGNSSSRESD